MRKKGLRSGYTTGACAAAAAKAAAMLLISATVRQCSSAIANMEEKISMKNCRSTVLSLYRTVVEIPFPDGSRVNFKIHNSELITLNSQLIARASVIKDAGDDPDVTNGAEISATVRQCDSATGLIIKGGKGVGIVTKPGLPVPVGEAAINPVPRRMIREAVMEIVQQCDSATVRQFNIESKLSPTSAIEITISVVDGEKLAKKTLNHRLGIVGGISILGTTGIVRPISSEAWTATITSSMDVAKAMGHDEIVLSAGRASEKAHMGKYNLPEESYVMMGDYLEYSLLEAKKHGFKKIHLCAQWAKMLKIAMATPQTHVRHGAIDIKKAMEFLTYLGIQNPEFRIRNFNTAREIFDFINSELGTRNSELFKRVCNTAKGYAEGVTKGVPVTSHLVSYEGEIIASSE